MKTKKSVPFSGPKGRDSIAQGAALGRDLARQAQPQRATPLSIFVAEFVRIRTFARLLRSLTTSATPDSPRFSVFKILNGIAQRGETPAKSPSCYAPLGLANVCCSATQGCALGYRVLPRWGEGAKQNTPVFGLFNTPVFGLCEVCP